LHHCTFLAGSDAVTVMIKGSLASRMTGTKSVTGSYGRVAYRCGPMPCVVIEFKSRV